MEPNTNVCPHGVPMDWVCNACERATTQCAQTVHVANDRQVGGSHYKTGGEEHWDRVARLQLDYFQGQITKYVERWKKKNGLEDLHKARHFLDKYIELAPLFLKEGDKGSAKRD
jgi:Protein of unknwon function (DUF3310)